MKRLGALPSQTIREMIAAHCIQHADENHVQPASLDLTLADEFYRVQSLFLPRQGEPIRDAMRLVAPERHDPSYPLERNVTYLARLNESLKLPGDVYAYTNPKSSTGRTDVHVRMVADGMTQFDSAGMRGYTGELWALITPHSFRVKLNQNDSLLQMRFFNGDTRFATENELEVAYKRHSLLYTKDKTPIPYGEMHTNDSSGKITLTLDLDLDIVGYRSEGSPYVLDFGKRNFYDPSDFFDAIPRPKKGEVTLRRGDFYIFITKEYVRVPRELGAEVAPIDIRAGDFRAHYAGYFDPGWGYGPEGKVLGAPAVLEVRSFEENLTIRDGQPICKIAYERMTEPPERVYGETGSHYFDQRGPQLSKHFRQKT